MSWFGRSKPDAARKFFEGNKPFSVVDNAANLVGNFMHEDDDADGRRADIALVFLHACSRSAELAGAPISFVESITAEIDSTEKLMTVRKIADTATKCARQMYTELDQTLARASDAYSAVAVLCHGKAGAYERGTPAYTVFEMVAQLFGAVHAASMSGGGGRGTAP